MTGSAQVIRGNARDLPLADDSVDLVVTSPPYFALRSYQDGGEHYAGQIGDEPTPAEFVDSLLEVTRECVRVLKPSGSLWVNLGDKYAGSRMDGSNDNGSRGTMVTKHRAIPEGQRQSRVASAGRIPTKSLIGIPWRYALRCIDDLGLILRAEVIWSKPNGLPESVTDRVRRSHEQWFHFTLQPRYFSAVDEIREQYEWDYSKGYKMRGNTGARENRDSTILADPRRTMATHRDVERGANPLGKLPGSVWTIPTEPLKVPDHLGVDHFAAFPTEWPKRIISGWSPAGVCVECGEGRRGDECACNARIATPTGSGRTDDPSNLTGRAGFNRPRAADEGVRWITRWEQRHEAAQLRDSPHRAAMSAEAGPAFAHYLRTDDSGARPIPEVLRQAWRDRGWLNPTPEYVPATTSPAVVLDPFGGTGTTAMVAKALGRHGISVDMSADYCRLAEWRTNDRNQLAKVLGIEKTAAPDPEQMDLFGGAA